jgi:hypothetical protein
MSIRGEPMTALPVLQHPILGSVAELEGALDQVADAQPVYLSTGEKADAMRRLARVEARVAGLRLGVMAAAGDVAEETGARVVAAWYSQHTRTESDQARAEDRLAQSLDREWSRVAAALAEGRCSVAQARVIARGLEELPSRVGRETIEQAECTLVEYAAQFRPSELRRLGRRILDIVAPEIADAEEARRLADEERHAREKTRLSLRPLGDGTTRHSGRIPDASASRLKTYLDAFTSPRVSTSSTSGDGVSTGSTNGAGVSTGSTTGDGDRMPYPRRLGLGFCAFLDNADPSRLPEHGGDATTVVVTITLEQLRAELATAGILDGVSTGSTADLAITAGVARRLACTAGILPAVLGGTSEVLDLGRTRRLFSPAQRKALRIRDQRCRAEGCTIPATWTEAHHLQPWQHGGHTDLANAILLCSHHHHRAHDDRHLVDRLPNGDLRFTRRR